MAQAAEKPRHILGGTKGKLVRFSYLNVHKARLNTESGKMEHGVTALIPKTNTEDVKFLKDAIKALLKATFTDQKKPIPPGHWNPLRDGDTDTKQNGNAYGEEAKGHYVLNCKSGEEYPPGVVGTTRTAGDKLARIGVADIKSGDWGRIDNSLYGYTKGTGGVGIGLNSVQLVQEGEALSGGRSADDAFGGFEDDDVL